MSWIELLRDRDFTIITGDGAEYRPTWLNARRDVQFNNRIYNFPGVPGSIVDRREKIGDKYLFEIYFTGSDNIAEATNFEVSARDQRAWRVIHPFYGNLVLQPLRIRIDNTKYNVSKLVIDLIEVMQLVQPISVTRASDRIIQNNIDVGDLAVSSYGSNVPVPTIDDSVDFSSFISDFNTVIGRAIIDNDSLAEFKDLVSTANSFVSELIFSSTRLLRSLVNLINYPAMIAQNLESRFDGLIEVFDNLNTQLFDGDLDDITPNRKNYYLVTGGSIISAMAYASIVNPDQNEDQEYTLSSDYRSRSDIVRQIEQLLRYYNLLLENLARLTTERADDNNSFVPDHDYLFSLRALVIDSVRSLEGEIFGSIQEREVFLTEPADVITLTHRFYGIATNENIEDFININSLSLNDVLEIKSERFVRFYA